MKLALRKLAVAGSAAALVLVAAPAAHAGPGDPDCTTTYVGTLTSTATPEFVEYTPPADVDVNGNAIVGTAFFVAGATVDYVDCVV